VSPFGGIIVGNGKDNEKREGRSGDRQACNGNSMTIGYYSVTLIREGSSNTFNTSESGHSDEEVRIKIEDRYPGCTITRIDKK